MTLGTVAGSTVQIGLGSPAAHTPNVNGCGVAANPRAWSELKPSWPVRATANAQPDPTVPKADCGTASVAVRLGPSATNCGVPSGSPEAETQIGGAKPCASSRSLQPG